jgi:hypothetical protein
MLVCIKIHSTSKLTNLGFKSTMFGRTIAGGMPLFGWVAVLVNTWATVAVDTLQLQQINFEHPAISQ